MSVSNGVLRSVTLAVLVGVRVTRGLVPQAEP